jgi:hypothetical protein
MDGVLQEGEGEIMSPNRYLYMYIPLNHGSLLAVQIARCAKPIGACQFGEVSANISQFNLYCFH